MVNKATTQAIKIKSEEQILEVTVNKYDISVAIYRLQFIRPVNRIPTDCHENERSNHHDKHLQSVRVDDRCQSTLQIATTFRVRKHSYAHLLSTI